MSHDLDTRPDTMARVSALLAHLSNVVWIAGRDGDAEELLAQIRLEAECAKELGLRAPGERREERWAAL